MEKYSRYRDQGSGIAPFFPIPAHPSGLYLPLNFLLFCIRLPLLLSFLLGYVLIFSWLPIGSLGRKAVLWCILGVPGIWWVDLQIDGVKRGSLSTAQALKHLPAPGSIIVPTSTSPLDTIYLAAVFDPLFLRSWPQSRRVGVVTIFTALLNALTLDSLALKPPPESRTYTLAEVVQKHPDNIIVLPAESTPTNGRAILPLSPALATAPPSTPIFPTSLRYTPPDVTTPVPGWRGTWRFLWVLCSRPTHTVRVRIAEPTRNVAMDGSNGNGSAARTSSSSNPYSANFFDDFQREPVEATSRADDAPPSAEERKLLDRVGESLARLGRVKRVVLGTKDKSEFVTLWRKRGRG